VTPSHETPGATLKVLRINAGLSIRQLAKEVGIDESVVRGYQHNEYIPRPESAKKVADRLGVSVTSIWPPEVF
jgi:ribosome-binding protein aMBF1 (putative translation factor)